ncbi:Hsp20/alpha crystallin family protein [Saccharomonospora glauca]|jgi:HSP20 family protein|uniref:Molecular chaperone (Small heat shock protein) n=1 Tax=Saccharomonospora glauca K62 TaxID=928724 RepID=I1D3G1_9PSEU|nr:Hsp20/alpha crystallin family protein [Saccharomonospora glauca]EIE99485.1 molecular chaperone (small heat shock protein) [Saccharomonospora glauca K62]
MSQLERSHGHSLIPDFRDLIEMLPTMGGLRPALDLHSIRIEDRIEGNTYVLRAELPGIDVDKDLTITVHNGLLTIEAERSEEQSEGGRSEFRYGSFARTVALPTGAREDAIDASYDDGILTIKVELSKPEENRRQIRVRHD